VVLLFLLWSPTAVAATKVIWHTDKPDEISKLNDDLRQAIASATLNKKQRNELEKSNLALQRAVDGHNEGRSFDKDAVVKAYKQIETMNKADVFSAQDKKTIQKDLGKLKDQVYQQPPPRRRRYPYGYPVW
jgi:hypothetical protein